jgi:hypothetical protein
MTKDNQFFKESPEWETLETHPPIRERRVSGPGRPQSDIVKAILAGNIVKYKGHSFGAYAQTVRRNMPEGYAFHQTSEGEYVIGWIDQDIGRVKSPPKYPITSRIPKEMHEDVKAVAIAKGMTVSNYVMKAIEDALEYED